MDGVLFARNAQGINKIYHEVILLMKILQTKTLKPQVKHMNIKYYDLFFTVIKNRDEKEITNNHYEDDYIIFKDFITPNQYIGIKIILKYWSGENWDLL